MGETKNPVGRPATPVRKAFRDILAELNVNTVQRLVAIAEHRDTPLEMAKSIYSDFLKYEYATVKEIHNKHEVGKSFEEWLATRGQTDRPRPATVAQRDVVQQLPEVGKRKSVKRSKPSVKEDHGK